MSTKLRTAEKQIKNVTILSVYLLLVWGFYRYLFQLPETVEELLIKPVIWLVPLFVVLRKEGRGLSSLGFTFKNLFPAIYFSLALGAIFAIEGIFINYLKYRGFDFSANIGQNFIIYSLGLSLVTAFTEETVFRGYIFGRLWQATNNEIAANLISSGIWALIHLPITIFVWNLNLSAVVTYLLLTTIFAIGSAFVYAKTKNIVAPILLHVLWSWPIILFR